MGSAGEGDRPRSEGVRVLWANDPRSLPGIQFVPQHALTIILLCIYSFFHSTSHSAQVLEWEVGGGPEAPKTKHP